MRLALLGRVGLPAATATGRLCVRRLAASHPHRWFADANAGNAAAAAAATATGDSAAAAPGVAAAINVDDATAAAMAAAAASAAAAVPPEEHTRRISEELFPPNTRIDSTLSLFEEIAAWREANRDSLRRMLGFDKYDRAVPAVHERRVDALGRAIATGRRKTSVASVSVREGTGRITVNRLPLSQYFQRLTLEDRVLAPFVAVGALGRFDAACFVEGGGKSGQAGAIRHGIARALQNFDPSLRTELKKAGFLTRDPRMVERKKPGQAKARKKFQWVKR